jgi:hypothetical protein
MKERLKDQPRCVEVECAMKEQWDEVIKRVEELEQLVKSLVKSEVHDDGR